MAMNSARMLRNVGKNGRRRKSPSSLIRLSICLLNSVVIWKFPMPKVFGRVVKRFKNLLLERKGKFLLCNYLSQSFVFLLFPAHWFKHLLRLQCKQILKVKDINQWPILSRRKSARQWRISPKHNWKHENRFETKNVFFSTKRRRLFL